jgi:predicted SnoaL-like aldol condensation-catalyzing enzyme
LVKHIRFKSSLASNRSRICTIRLTTKKLIIMTNKELVIKALTELFINGDATALDRYWSENYIQHNPQIPNGREAVKQLMSGAGNMKYEMGLVVADGDFVMVHARITGLGPKPLIGVDIFRVIEKKLVEHWDVLQEEVPAENTASENPMFPINS